MAWRRAVLRRPNTRLKWTSTENNRKYVCRCRNERDGPHPSSIHSGCRAVVCHLQTRRSSSRLPLEAKRLGCLGAAVPLPGVPVDGNDPGDGLPCIYLPKLCEQKGWHHLDQMGVNVAFGARSYRTPEPRFGASSFPYRTTFGRLEQPPGCRWRRLTTDEGRHDLNQHALLSERFGVLITFFKSSPG